MWPPAAICHVLKPLWTPTGPHPRKHCSAPPLRRLEPPWVSSSHSPAHLPASPVPLPSEHSRAQNLSRGTPSVDCWPPNGPVSARAYTFRLHPSSVILLEHQTDHVTLHSRPSSIYHLCQGTIQSPCQGHKPHMTYDPWPPDLLTSHTGLLAVLQPRPQGLCTSCSHCLEHFPPSVQGGIPSFPQIAEEATPAQRGRPGADSALRALGAVEFCSRQRAVPGVRSLCLQYERPLKAGFQWLPLCPGAQ